MASSDSDHVGKPSMTLARRLAKAVQAAIDDGWRWPADGTDSLADLLSRSGLAGLEMERDALLSGVTQAIEQGAKLTSERDELRSAVCRAQAETADLRRHCDEYHASLEAVMKDADELRSEISNLQAQHGDTQLRLYERNA